MALLAWIGRIAVHYDIYFEGNSGGGENLDVRQIDGPL